MTPQTRNLTIDNYTIKLIRNPAGDTDSHKNYRYSLILPDGSKLFGKQSDVIGISKYVKQSRNSAALNALFAVCIQDGDTDPEWFDTYTELERAWSRSFNCERLFCVASDLERA